MIGLILNLCTDINIWVSLPFRKLFGARKVPFWLHQNRNPP